MPTRSFPSALLTLLLALSASVQAGGGMEQMPVYEQDADAFSSAKGERALVMGYRRGLEVWAYPLQLVSDYTVRFHKAGEVTSHDGAALLRRVERGAAETVRVYVGPDFVVRERLFVPRARPGAIIRYEVEGRADVRIEVAFRPSLDLMWPGALGGQSVEWSTRRSAYLLREPLHGFVAAVVAPEAVAHDVVVNRTRPVDDRLRLMLAPRGGRDGVRAAVVYLGLDEKGGAGQAGEVERLRADEANLRREAADHDAAAMADSLKITTPDEAVNRALASASLAIERAWVCNDAIGCGFVAGYGPSRRGRRPQYAWFFAGDGLVATQGALAAGRFERARDELRFIARHQDAKSGMIWHEISQSAGLIDWRNKYHYMFVHVDITLQYLAALEEYVATAGDEAFARDGWAGIAAAWGYARSIVDPATGLPRIPEGKQGPNEQDQLRDDIRVTSLWIDAADAFARLARRLGRTGAATDAERGAARARAALAKDGWDEERGFWLSGHAIDGTPVREQRPDAAAVLTQEVFSDAQAARVLDRLSSPDFATDWGLRNLSANDPRYDPNLYGGGSVWGLGTAGMVRTFWARHRPLAAWPLWRGLVEWNTLESGGHLHELMAGDLFHPELESVPEQTWSSAGLLLSGVRGLFGLEVRSAERRVILAPHLPLAWNGVALEHVRVGDTRIDLQLARTAKGFRLEVINPGAAIAVEFAPALPPGARAVGARVNGVPGSAAEERHDGDGHARLSFTAGPGRTVAELAHEGGAAIEPVLLMPREGDRSRNPKPVAARFENDALVLETWLIAPKSVFNLISARPPTGVEGARIEPVGGQSYRLLADVAGAIPRRARITVRFARPVTP